MSVENLGETIHSLLGFKAHLTCAWAKSVCDIIKNLPSKDLERKDSELSISKIKDELAALTANINRLNIQRRQVLNDFLDLKGNIRVFCRIRPIRIGEHFRCLRPVVASESSTVILKFDDNKSKNYSFDKVFHPGSSQDEVFSDVEPLIKSVIDGYNACIFAYGQTGTGKTFTMEGTPDTPGVVPRAIEALFKQAEESNHTFLISFSMLEIYLGNLKDLLVTHPTKATDPLPPCLSIKTDIKGGIEIDNLVAIQVSDFNQALRLYRLGCRFRSTASTNSNTTSSRSHCMIRITITCFDALERRRETNKIWLVDLGGSERVLKTKAWGRRLDEGKAINLSLSVLGDVINALQRKKRHVPYRNSKLTQVLKDSLGDDSKTLMLAHISPKEEDLCETICSLNFATRAKSIHLGHSDSSETRNQKEVSMKNLQQKMKHIEEERLKVRRGIEKLNEKLENLTRPALRFEEQLQASHSSTEESLSNLKAKKNKTGDVIAAPMSELPRFMRPTFCSKRKSGMDPNTSEGKDQVLGRRRRPPSHRAVSVTFPVKNNSEYNSDCSISRSSCLAGLNLKRSADNETEYSQETLDYDSKMVAFSKQDTSQRTSTHQKAPFNYLEKNGNQKTEKINSTKFSKVDDWLSHKNESTISGYIHRSKRVLALPIPEKKKRGTGPSKEDKLYGDKVPAYEFTEENIISHSTAEKRCDVERVEMPLSAVISDKPQMMLKELFEQDSTFNSTSPSHESRDQTMTEMQDSIDGLSTEEGSPGNLSPPDICCGRLDQHKNDDEVYIMSTMPEVKGETQCSDNMLKNGECSFSVYDIDNSVINGKGDPGVSISRLELESLCQHVPTEKYIKDNEKEDLDGFSHPSALGTRANPLKLRSERALFMDNANYKDLITPNVRSQGRTQNEGICYDLKEKFQLLTASALLGLGLHDLGFGHDFFHGLMF
ncbi:hypothetical protein EZV62_001611 [Acer yangbiense]|uniref:Kinesin motor domain-containing protein n=1 Tax=Acer yangbiense TaxID=1000413 RepID=A0A5C7IWY2_9ROSI|nr:hypothetical protein EZV62_001611 [Acer yangbiense]